MAQQNSPEYQITLIANQLANEGKHPTIALIKSRLINALPLTVIISVLKKWQHDPELIAGELTKQDLINQKNELLKSDLEVALETQDDNRELLNKVIDEKLSPIKQELAEIKSLLSKIANKYD